MITRQINCSETARNRGFTLVEILVVLGIIAILMSLVVAAVVPALTGARDAATRSVIVQIDEQLQRRMNAFNGLDFKTTKDDVLENGGVALPNSELGLEAARRKAAYLACFPQRTGDLDRSQYGSSLKRNIAEDGAYAGKDLTGSELLYLLLTKGQALSNEEYSIDGIPSRHVQLSKVNRVLEFVDGWGNPIHFYNAPTALFAQANSSGEVTIDLSRGAKLHFSTLPTVERDLRSDPFDRLGRLNQVPAFRNLSNYYHPNVYFSYLLVSAGPDGDLGLNPSNAANEARLAQPLSTDSTSPIYGQMFDNITNRQQLLK